MISFDEDSIEFLLPEGQYELGANSNAFLCFTYQITIAYCILNNAKGGVIMRSRKTILIAAFIGASVPVCVWLAFAYVILMRSSKYIGWSGIEPIIIALFVMIFCMQALPKV